MNRKQVIIGMISLVLGLFVYVIDRPPDQTYFIYKAGMDISLYGTLPRIFGQIGNSLPSFLHVFSFTLITAGILSCTKRGYLLICLSWFLVDCTFEFGQKYKALAVRVIPELFDRLPFLENNRKYFLSGRFDPYDLAAIVFGSVAASTVFFLTHSRRDL
jgi:hypothetical protein